VLSNQKADRINLHSLFELADAV